MPLFQNAKARAAASPASEETGPGPEADAVETGAGASITERLPSVIGTSRKEQLDVSKIFLAYMVAHGDPMRAAQIAQCNPEDVLFLATTELWDSKLAQQAILKGATPEEARERTRELNRATNYVQALRMRELVDRTIKWCYEDEKHILNFCTEVDKQGKKIFSTKPMLELAKAAEVAQNLLYRALGDVIPRDGQTGANPGNSLKDLHRLMVAMGDHLSGPDKLQRNPVTLAAETVAVEEPKTEFLDADTALGADQPVVT